MPAVLWVLAIGSYWTFAHRMYHTWRELSKIEAKKQNADDHSSYSQATPNTGERRAEQRLVHKPS
jgi:hypothetical protein